MKAILAKIFEDIGLSLNFSVDTMNAVIVILGVLVQDRRELLTFAEVA